MYQYIYDGSFAGLLSTIFEIYDRKNWPDSIVKESAKQPCLFGQQVLVTTDEQKANRVWMGIGKKVSVLFQTNLYHTYLSEKPNAEMLIYQFMRLAFANAVNIEDNFAEDCVREIASTARQIFREKHRMEAFIRFQKTADNLYFASIEPDFNVVPLLINHFQKRYADQQWLIYDVKRNYGIYYDLIRVTEVTLDNSNDGKAGALQNAVLQQHETLYQDLWKLYFKSVNIQERKNKKLHLRHMPIRYWKYLTEKQIKPEDIR
ncbi:TIGR03915 family putative DNA repair protein [Adhaeribacter aquaticus]|uniref:TIGR03915 family putative DNA repair protein n=1 Tax=Adhaeribacter aquaticus TaxID=299567 RepID=UPI00042768AF|nr:TIGR03915 family putative DNA repair protein [Adhaeribacter aquaticus]